MPRSIRIFTLAGMAAAAIAIAPASASADLVPPTTNQPSVNFGSLPVGKQSLPVPVTLTESCTSLDCLTSIIPDTFSPVLSVTTGFTQSSNCPVSLLAVLGIPQLCTINVTFVPGVVGQITGLLSTGGGGPTVALNGVGTPASASGSNGRKRRKCKKHHKKNHHMFAAKAAKRCKKHK